MFRQLRSVTPLKAFPTNPLRIMVRGVTSAASATTISARFVQFSIAALSVSAANAPR